MAGFWLTKLGLIDVLAPESEIYEVLRKMGMTHSVSLVSLFVISHLNQSRYTGVNSLDWWQYFLIRMLSAALPLLVVLRAEVNGTIKYYFEILLVGLLWGVYLIFVDWSKSQESSLALAMDDAFSKQGRYNRRHTAEKTHDRHVYIMFRPDGRGGIQGILLDCYYMDADGRIANEFYVVRDSEEGEIERIDDNQLRKIESVHEIQKAFYEHFLANRPKQELIAS